MVDYFTVYSFIGLRYSGDGWDGLGWEGKEGGTYCIV